jgi:uncharacterized membrane protein SirB2
MDSYYFEIRQIHIAAVLASGSLFLLRALACNLFRSGWPMAAPVRYLSYAIDTILLLAAITLTTIIGQYPFVNGWLTVKALLLVAYIALGLRAFRAPRRAHRIGYTVAASTLFLFIISVARAHDPLGIFTTGRLW